MDEIFIEVSIIVSGSVQDSFELSFIFFDLYHFETILQQFVLFHIVQDGFI